MLSQALPLWEEAQAEFTRKLGPSNRDVMLKVLSHTVSAIRAG